MRTLGRALAWALSALVLVLPMLQPGGLLGPSLALASSSLSVTGDVSGLAPHVPASLTLTLHNDGSTDAVVSRLSAAVTGVDGSCSASSLTVTPWTGFLAVPAGGSVTHVLPVMLAEDCGVATWDLVYTAIAV